MKILIDSRLYGTENTGIGRYLINLIKELQVADKENNYTLLLRKKYFDQLNIPENWKKILGDFRHYTFSEQLLLPGILKKENPDLVHFPHFNVPVFWKGNFVVTIHDMSMHRQGIKATKLPLPVYYLKRLPYKFAFSDAVKRSKIIVTPTNYVKNEIVKYFNIAPGKVSVISEGIDDVFFKKTSVNILKKFKIENNYFVYAGNVYPHKNIDLLIDAILKINEHSTNLIKLIIVCPRSSFSRDLEIKIHKKNASRFVSLLGFVEDEDLATLYRLSQGFIYPSLSEGFGLPGLEAMASGTLVLASNIKVFNEVYSDFAFYFDPNSVNSLISKMKYVLELDPKKRELHIRKSGDFINKYSWKKTAADTLKIYKKAVG